MVSLKILLALGTCLQAKDLSYLPRNEDLESISNSQVLILKMFHCDAAESLIQRANDCQQCVFGLKPPCPNCCLASPTGKPYQALQCTAIGDPYGDDPAIGCKATPRFDNTCTQANQTASDQVIFADCTTTKIPHAQARGCPSLTAEDPTATPVVPSFNGCGTYINGFTGTYFNVAAGVANPTTAYSDFVNVCVQDADAKETCAKKVLCCKPGVCGGVGYAAGCVDLTCKTRIDTWEKPGKTVETIDNGTLTCPYLSTADCLALNDQVQKCLNDLSGGTCADCFKKIYPDDSFVYKFVPKSNEKVVLLWRLYTTSVGDSSQNDYFYSKIHVENSKGDVIYASPVHQKVFLGSFGVFSAIAVPASSLKTGEEYFARLYYFINFNPVLNLQMNVTGAEIVAIKVRE